MNKLLSASALAVCLSASAISQSHAYGFDVINGDIVIGGAGVLNLNNIDSNFSEPNWEYDLFPCDLFPVIWADYIAWENPSPPPPPYIPPYIPPPCDDCGTITPPPIVSVPETTTWLMLLLGFIGLSVPAMARSTRREATL